jgi:hypothetical protein
LFCCINKFRSSFVFWEKINKIQTSAPEAFGGEDDTDTAPDPDAKFSLEEELAAANLSHLLSNINDDFMGDVTKVTDNWLSDHCGGLQIPRVQTIIAKASGNLWYTGQTGSNKWWLNSTTKQYQYMSPKPAKNMLCVPVPDGFFNASGVPSPSVSDTETSRATKNWAKARSRMKMVQAFKKR